MDFSPTEEQTLVRDMARRYAERQLAPVAASLEAGDKRGLFLANLKGLAELGFMGLNIKSCYGGSEAGVVAFSLAITEIARACASTAVTMSVTNMVAEVIQSVANEDQKQAYLPKLCSGEYRAGSFCLSEAEAGSDPSAMTTRAVQDGSDWIIDGSKMWISSAEYAGIFVVWAVTNPEAPRGKGITCFLVEAGTPGVTIAPAEKKMGQAASATNLVIFENCRVSNTSIMGKLNDGFRIAVSELAGGRIGIASLALGVGLAAMDYARDYAKARKQFGQAVASMQGPQWMMADAYTELEAARLLTLSAACLKEQGLPFAPQASMAKLFASEKANAACYTALQLAGGIGYAKDAPLERFARDVRVTAIYEGTSEIQRMIIGRHVLSV
ncbi:MAG: acyl-CoA dehydrogenase family protein [Hyphomonas sp.]